MYTKRELSFWQWCGAALYSLTPERRRLIRLIHASINDRGHKPSEAKILHECVYKISDDRLMLRTVAKHIDVYLPISVVNVVAASYLPGDKRILTELHDEHFAICREMTELVGDRYIKLGSSLSPEATTVHRGSRAVLHHALYNTEDWPFIVPLLRDRNMWNLDDVLATMAISRSNGATAMAEGAL